MPNTPHSAYDESTAPRPGHPSALAEEVARLNDRLQREAVVAVELVEQAVRALRSCDRALASEVRRRDTEVDREEIRIEEECIRLIALHQPVARDLRSLMIVIKVNADLERIADHATGVAKAVAYLGEAERPAWPRALLDLGERVIPLCHDTVRALGQRDGAAAQSLIGADKTLDRLTKKVVEEVESAIADGSLSRRAGLLAFRASRDLERIGDLCVNICEDIVYADTGRIVRHAGKLGEPG
ncbi:MAG: phosphate transport system regulatory protein PhoU [Planctomycetota bacterium]|nr:MAG: phosphate transport system regulatory protein PhoU [Planctomycetota bacterium]